VSGFGRIPICDVSPIIDHGAYPAKATLGESAPIRATVFREGHDAVGATAVLVRPDGSVLRQDLRQVEPWGLDIWETWVTFDTLGDWAYHIEAWADTWHTWTHNAQVKWSAGQDTELMCLEVDLLFQSAAESAKIAKDNANRRIITAARQIVTKTLTSKRYDIPALLQLTSDAALNAAMSCYAPRHYTTRSERYAIRVDRLRAQFASWYEFFPRSIGAKYDEATKTWHSGTFDSCTPALEHAAQLGFDVVYLPPIHPIGTTMRKGANNSLHVTPADPGSPWAIGSPDGGHDAIHPDLGDLAAFDRFVAQAHALGLEVALDFALQASPDHPWLQTHPEWFTTRLDGTIAYAENPPKKYQDIYPINFDNDPEGIRQECLRILEFWIAHGVTIFRVDNPHTKPIDFWEWLLAAVYEHHPEIIFFAEAFTRPAMLQGLAKVGFHENYTYFTWRNTKWELAEYLNELAQETAWQLRPNFFVNTPDINPLFLQTGNPAAFAIRAILAATMSPAWGVYSGFEQFEYVPLRAGGEEYLDSEKYQYRPRDFDTEPNLNLLIGVLNRIRREHPALQRLRTARVLPTTHDQLFAFSKTDGASQVIVVVSLNQDVGISGEVRLDNAALGIADGTPITLRDELTGHTYEWVNAGFVQLTPAQPAHIFTVNPPTRSPLSKGGAPEGGGGLHPTPH
jgi:starch synthase (maltosyl-transferring)